LINIKIQLFFKINIYF